ncbi:MAG TPA: hypothetical protein VG452_06555 [Egibacteraceae bacterium]|nr:hypothetical protein [Actinomycetota bacterium]HWB71859.1 hypothetical protein [Egibacteraceae bacterium]
MTHEGRPHLDKHSDKELRRAVETAESQDERLIEEGSEAALDAERTQRAAMEEELERRES